MYYGLYYIFIYFLLKCVIEFIILKVFFVYFLFFDIRVFRRFKI